MLGLVLLQLVVVVSIMLAGSVAVFVGRQRLETTRRDLRSRLRAAGPVALVLAFVLLFNGVARQLVPELSWMLGWERTYDLYLIEGQFISWLQSFEHPSLTAYFSFVYVYGYAYLLVFPLIAYLALRDTRPLRELLSAYAFNYGLGLVCYVLVIAYGPRNLMPELVDGLLYDAYPRYQHLTRQVNRNTNVFPSLHTSLAVTVGIFGYRTRDRYPRWWYLSAILAVSVAISTMYLGIHWVVDVIAGTILAWVSVRGAERVVGRWSITDGVDDHLDRLPRLGGD